MLLHIGRPPEAVRRAPQNAPGWLATPPTEKDPLGDENYLSSADCQRVLCLGSSFRHLSISRMYFCSVINLHRSPGRSMGIYCGVNHDHHKTCGREHAREVDDVIALARACVVMSVMRATPIHAVPTVALEMLKSNVRRSNTATKNPSVPCVRGVNCSVSLRPSAESGAVPAIVARPRFCGGDDREIGMPCEESRDLIAVLLGQHRARHVDEPPARPHQGRRHVENRDLLRAALVQLRARQPPFCLGMRRQTPEPVQGASTSTMSMRPVSAVNCSVWPASITLTHVAPARFKRS